MHAQIVSRFIVAPGISATFYLFDGAQCDEARQQESHEAGGENEEGRKDVEGLLVKEVPERRHLAVRTQEQLGLGRQLVTTGCLGHGQQPLLRAGPRSAALLGSSGGHTEPLLADHPRTQYQRWALIGRTTLQS